ncbi:MAG: asparagine synthase-related protein [Planctomycetota bacterium]|nr:asparagine synthase-related protein [Planctomycetota bacterium]
MRFRIYTACVLVITRGAAGLACAEVGDPQIQNFLPRFRQMVWHLDDPIGDPITQPNFELAAHASRDVRFIFNGEGGDPCFGGPKNICMMLHHWYGGLNRGENFRERHYLESYRRAWDEIEFLLSDVRQQINIARRLVRFVRCFVKPLTFLHGRQRRRDTTG